MLRVASVPSRHPYVARIGGGVTRLPDPERAPGVWWPPAMVDPGWIAANAARFDLMHLHFGLESFPPEHLRATLAALAERGKPLVFTVHDLENPQLHDQHTHRAQLDVLVPGADALVTLTDGAAREIRARWGRTAHVIAHPDLLTGPPPPGVPNAVPVVGLSLRDLRPNLDALTAARTTLDAVEPLDAEVRIDLHEHVRDEDARARLRALAPLVEHPRPDDAALAETLAGADVQVLPYTHGTHSGWLELCWDVGVPVAVPRVGHFAEQHPDPTFAAPYDPGDAVSLRHAIGQLLATAPRAGSADRRALTRARRQARSLQRREISAAHTRVYASVPGTPRA